MGRWRPPIAGRKDANHRVTVKALEMVGASVEPTNERGKPDLLVGYLRVTHLMEVKNPEAGGKLEPAQEKFIQRWRGRPVAIVDGPLAALREIGIREDVAQRVVAVVLAEAQAKGGKR